MMAHIQTQSIGWHEGERSMHSLLRVPEYENPTTLGLSPYASSLAVRSPLCALGVIDEGGKPWTTLLGGEPAFTRPLGHSMIGIKALVDRKYDPVIEILSNAQQDGRPTVQIRGGLPIAGLPIDLVMRSRVKLSGRLIASALSQLDSEEDEISSDVGKIQLIISVERSLGNCPKYINKKQIIPALPDPVILSASLPLSTQALKLIAKADLFFISSSYHDSNIGTNDRGGPPGFVRVLKNDSSGVSLVYPEYSGNRLYQTLGNLQKNPRAGLVFPDFETQDVLFVTGTTETIVGKAAAALLPRSNIVVKVNLTAARFVQKGLAFRGIAGEPSPYNPLVRYLPSEHDSLDAKTASNRSVYASLLKKDLVTPTIAKFRFKINDPVAAGPWSPGQYVALSFEDELGMGYSHMRDDDPRSLNDDFVRTFTVSSPRGRHVPDNEFEITVRNVGVATDFLFRHNVRSGLELPLNGFGGSFALPVDKFSSFVAGGIGITPLLAQAAVLESSHVRLFWMINLRDINLVVDTFEQYPWLAVWAKVFVSGVNDEIQSELSKAFGKIEEFGSSIFRRRLLASDLSADPDTSSTWYLCTGTEVRKTLLDWLFGKTVIYEDFNY